MVCGSLGRVDCGAAVSVPLSPRRLCLCSCSCSRRGVKGWWVARDVKSWSVLTQPLGVAQNSESKKEEFRKYLERAGVIDALTKGETAAPPARKHACPSPALRALPGCRAAVVTTLACLVLAVLVALYETSEKPANALE